MSDKLETVETQDTPTSNNSTMSATPFLKNHTEKGKEMADIVTGSVTGFVNNNPEVTLAAINDTRRENTVDHASINLENMKGFDRVNADVLQSAWKTSDTVKDARHDINSRISESAASASRQLDAIDDTHMAAFMTVGRDTADLRAQVTGLGYQMRDGFFAAAKDSEINALKTQVDAAKNTTYLSDKIGAEGDRTRALINDLKYHDLSRHLVERNAELVEAAEAGRYWRNRADQNAFQGQFAALQNQIQAFGSNLQDTRNSLVNFGSMSKGAGNQSATSNSV